ncbi:MAG: amidohydrolase family protein, partial [Bacteroidota bacterium]|nr:amidohydrolase family protein [Bacteroidota bacterium]
DLQADDLIERLDWYRSFSVLKGFRHLLHDEPRRNLMNQPAFLNGIAALSRYDYTYDILIYPDQLKYAAWLAGLFPQQKLVLDLLVDSRHCGLDIVRWREDIWDLARRQHVYCKISGMIPIAGSDASARVDFHRYIDEMVKAFGMDRVMFGCDWPLRQAAAAYEAGTRLVQSYFSTFSRMEQELFYIWNAVNFYNL